MSSFTLRQISDDQTVPLRQSVLRPGLPQLSSRYENDRVPRAGHFGVFDGEKLVSVGSVFEEVCGADQADEAMRSAGAWRLRGMATDPAYRSKGCGAKVLLACLDHAKRAGGKLVWAHGRTGADRFYMRYGFRKMGTMYDLPPIGPHYLIRIDL